MFQRCSSDAGTRWTDAYGDRTRDLCFNSIVKIDCTGEQRDSTSLRHHRTSTPTGREGPTSKTRWISKTSVNGLVGRQIHVVLMKLPRKLGSFVHCGASNDTLVVCMYIYIQSLRVDYPRGALPTILPTILPTML